MSDAPLAIQLPLDELVQVVETAGVLKIMARTKRKKVVVDYVPARPALVIPRDESNKSAEAYPLNPITLTFTLEDAMFGGVCFAALCCGHRVVINPFPWTNFDALAKITLSLTR